MAKKEEKKMIDFTKCKVAQIDGATTDEDLSGIAKDIANIVFKDANELSVYNACIDIYKTGKCEWEQKVVDAFKGIIDKLLIGGEPASIVLKKALLSAME